MIHTDRNTKIYFKGAKIKIIFTLSMRVSTSMSHFSKHKLSSNLDFNDIGDKKSKLFPVKNTRAATQFMTASNDRKTAKEIIVN